MKTNNTTEGKTSKQVTTILDEIVTIEKGMWFVTMTDKLLTGWGLAEHKTAKRVIICKDLEQAEQVYNRIISRQPRCQMIYVNVTPTLPHYSASRYHTSWELYTDSCFNY